MSYNSNIRDQYLTDPNISSITECIDEKGRVIDQCVARDTYRCYALEETYPNVKVYTANKCTDFVRTVDNDKDPFNINSDVCTNQFMRLLIKKKWRFNEIYMDTIRMYPSYVEKNWAIFLNKLAEMKFSDVLYNDGNKLGKIYLPFNAHFFIWLNAMIKSLHLSI